MSENGDTTALDQSFTAMDIDPSEEQVGNSIHYQQTISGGESWGDMPDLADDPATAATSVRDDCIVQEAEPSYVKHISPNISYASVASGIPVPPTMSVLDAIYSTDEVEVTHKEDREMEEEPRAEKKQRICKFFNSRKGCTKGDNCTFKHERQVCAFFSSSQGCSAGNDCPFIHDANATQSVRLKPCPNEHCTNLCIGKQCMQCHAAMKPEQTQRPRESRYRRTYSRRRPSRSPRRRSRSRSRSRSRDRRRGGSRGYHPYRSRSYAGKEYRRRDDSRIRACPEPGCRNTCLGRRCRECHFRSAARNSRNRNRDYRSDDDGFHDEK